MTHLLAALSILLGGAIVAYAVQTAIRTFLLPQPGMSLLSRSVFRAMKPFFEAIARAPMMPGRRRDWMDIYAPLCLVLIVFATMVIISIGYALMLYGLGAPSAPAALLLSVSSLSTLGFAPMPAGYAIPIVATIETMTGILVVALLIGFLPTIYAAIQQRQQSVAALATRVGTPLSAERIVQRYAAPPGPDRLDELWRDWTRWFDDLADSHDSLAGIVFVRSPQPRRPWPLAAGAVLDAAALAISVLDRPDDADAEQCLIAGSHALRQVVGGIRRHPLRRAHGQTAQLTRQQFDAACDALAAAGFPVAADRAAAWEAFAALRARYDADLATLYRLADASSGARADHQAASRGRASQHRQP
ncbi:MAG: hypothetical protein IT337_08405 [Thermomicrobiales bacterium]|nr:hypothetical protein [Thermomicrobiales bacterium]